jgi:hypothetical protein
VIERITNPRKLGKPRNKVEGKSLKESPEAIEREFFKNNMSVLFSVNGQVHGHYTSEFITRSLRMPLLKSHLLIHVDCTHMRMAFRNELFMASRDRLKGADETRMLRDLLSDLLSRGKLQEIYKQRKDSISLEPGDTKDTNELLRAFTKSMPLNSELFKLLSNTFKLDIPKEPPTRGEAKKKKDEDSEKKEPFKPNRFPSFFKLRTESTEEKPAAKIPLNGSRSVKLLTDVENQYFDRTQDPGDMRISLVSLKRGDGAGGSHVLKSHKGHIKSITEEQIKLADKKYISSVYFHTLFLFALAKSKNYSVKQGENEKDITDFLKDIFSSAYSEFLLNFGTEQLMASLEL